MEKFSSTLTKCLGTYSRLRHMKIISRCSIHTQSALQYKWEPDDLKLEPDIPEYNNVNLSIKGYDFPQIESFAKFVHRVAMNLEIDTETWAVPPTKLEIKTLKFNTPKVMDSCKLNIYERVVQLEDCPAPRLPIILEFIRNNIPQGVDVSVKEHTEEDAEYLYVPDFDKIKLEEQLEELDN